MRNIRILLTAIAAVVCIVCGLSGGSRIRAQEPAPAPVLTNEQKLQVKVLAQTMEIAQLKAQSAQREFEAAREALVALQSAWKRDGYTLDLQRGVYVQDPVPTAQPPAVPPTGGGNP